MDIHEWHAQRFRELMEAKCGPKVGQQKRIAAKLDREPSYISGILHKKKRLGVELINEIERILEVPGWFSGGPAQSWDPDTIRWANWFQNLDEKKRLDAIAAIMMEEEAPAPRPKKSTSRQTFTGGQIAKKRPHEKEAP